MYTGKLIFSQVLDFMPMHTFRRCVARYHGDHNVRSFTCLDQYLCMAFAQLTYRESLRDIEACLRAQQQKLYHMGIRGTVAKSNLADANEQRSWRIYTDLAHSLIITAVNRFLGLFYGKRGENTLPFFTSILFLIFINYYLFLACNTCRCWAEKCHTPSGAKDARCLDGDSEATLLSEPNSN